MKDSFLGFEGSFDLHHIYRSLDELSRYTPELLSHSFKVQKRLAKEDISVVLFDVTTLYFESKHTDDIREFGYSKDCQFSDVHVVLSLLINKDGRPIGYELFNGSTYEGETLLPCLQKLQHRYGIQDVIIVADRGLSSFHNLQSIKAHGFDYIMGSRLGSRSQSVQEAVFNQAQYIQLTHKEEALRYKILEDKKIKKVDGQTLQMDDKLLCLYSSKRARKDRADRERLVVRAKDMMDKGSYKDKRGAKKYLKMNPSPSEACLHEDKIMNDSRFDGYDTINYSQEDADPMQILESYKGLWRIEASFRSIKHFFAVRPMFHWTKKRIEGHVMLNFLSLVLEYDLELRLKDHNHKLTQVQIREAIQQMERSILKVGDAYIASYPELSTNQLAILEALSIPKTQNHTLVMKP